MPASSLPRCLDTLPEKYECNRYITLRSHAASNILLVDSTMSHETIENPIQNAIQNPFYVPIIDPKCFHPGIAPDALNSALLIAIFYFQVQRLASRGTSQVRCGRYYA